MTVDMADLDILRENLENLGGEPGDDEETMRDRLPFHFLELDFIDDESLNCKKRKDILSPNSTVPEFHGTGKVCQ
jgi:hypothetical protein